LTEITICNGALAIMQDTFVTGPFNLCQLFILYTVCYVNVT